MEKVISFLVVMLLSPMLFADKKDDIVEMWTNEFNSQKIRQTDPRRDKFEEYANNIIEVLSVLKKESSLIGVSDGLKIYYPKNDEKLHLVVAAMVLRETALRHRLVGKKGEVGLLQVWGAAQNNIRDSRIKNNPYIGIYLGTRWLLHCIYLSDKKINKIDDYVMALSYYTCGPKCKGKKISAVTYRLKLVKKYNRSEIDMKPIERLIEAVSTTDHTTDDWYTSEVFTDKTDARETLNKASNSDDEELKEFLVEIMFDGVIMDEYYDNLFDKAIKQLKNDLT